MPRVALYLQQGQQPGNANLPMPPNPLDAGGPATRIVQLTEAVTLEELANDEEYKEIVDDMREECGKVNIPYLARSNKSAVASTSQRWHLHQ